GVVLVGEGDRQKAVVMLTTGSGLYKGSYNTIMANEVSNNQAYTIEVDGQKIDTRKAMTGSVYQAFIEQAIKSGVDPLPDSPPALAEKSGQPWTETWLTGSPIVAFRAYVCAVGNAGRPHYFLRGRHGNCHSLRIRPGAVV
ncbi:MAG: hypothetical protein AAB914_01685, partial [Patescibacteria group bacterium]